MYNTPVDFGLIYFEPSTGVGWWGLYCPTTQRLLVVGMVGVELFYGHICEEGHAHVEPAGKALEIGNAVRWLVEVPQGPPATIH